MASTPQSTKNTTLFYAQSALAFAIALLSTCIGIAYLPAEPWTRAFLALAALFLVTSSFSLAKCVRDAQETGSVISRLDEARLERLLAEFDPYRTPGLPPVAGPTAPMAGAATPAQAAGPIAQPPAYPSAFEPAA